MRRHSNAIKHFFHAYPFGVLLIAVLTMIVGAPLSTILAHHIPLAQGPNGLAPFTILLTLAAAYAVWVKIRPHVVVIIASGLILALLVIGIFLTSRQRVPDFAHLLGQVVFLVYVLGAILRTVFHARIVDGNILCGAACIYLLAGAIWGYIYAMLEVVSPGSFKIVAPNMALNIDLYDEPGWLVYFSYTTLTTVGFGDVLPGNSLGRSLVVLEAVIGQIMLVVMMARLVGLHVAHSTRSHPGKFEITTHEKN